MSPSALAASLHSAAVLITEMVLQRKPAVLPSKITYVDGGGEGEGEGGGGDGEGGGGLGEGGGGDGEGGGGEGEGGSGGESGGSGGAAPQLTATSATAASPV